MANRYAGANEPDDILDFHTLGPVQSGEVKRCTEAFVRASAKAGHARLRIVTGKGLHSSGDPVVKPQVARTLRALEIEGLVAGFAPERLDRGGDGAFVVTLT
ncbi:MAG: Smr/MutS family protein [Planctomycetota bacterium]|nr:Smr/MutS family protein [Planctomycetota bacterium]